MWNISIMSFYEHLYIHITEKKILDKTDFFLSVAFSNCWCTESCLHYHSDAHTLHIYVLIYKSHPYGTDTTCLTTYESHCAGDKHSATSTPPPPTTLLHHMFFSILTEKILQIYVKYHKDWSDFSLFNSCMETPQLHRHAQQHHIHPTSTCVRVCVCDGVWWCVFWPCGRCRTDMSRIECAASDHLFYIHTVLISRWHSANVMHQVSLWSIHGYSITDGAPPQLSLGSKPTH